MKKVLVIQHVAHEILGTFHPLLKQAGIRIRYANFGREPHPVFEMKRYDGLVILGGPMGVYESNKYPHLLEEIECARQAMEQGKPVLGICLGAQLIAAALKAGVTPNQKKEIGWYDVSLTTEGKTDPLLGELAGTEKIFQWHGDTFQVPQGAARLAESSACANQAFRYGTNVYGFQFHLEVDEAMVERWLSISSMQAELCALAGHDSPEKIRSDTAKYIARQKELGRKVFSRYLELFSTKRKAVILGSGHK